MDSESDKGKVNAPGSKALFGVSIVAGIFIIIWFILGAGAFITSLVCLGRSGSTADKIMVSF